VTKLRVGPAQAKPSTARCSCQPSGRRECASSLLDEEAHYIHTFCWNRLVPLRSYVHGWKIGPSHYSNQDLGTIWLSAPECGACSEHPTMEKAEVETDK
jgi:hypothetical protein